MTAKQQVKALLKFIDASPSPYHAVSSMREQISEFGFEALDESQKWTLEPGNGYYVIRDDSSIILFKMGNKPLTETGYKIVGAHTDSPGLRIKPNPMINSQGLIRLGVEVYGGPILATFSDRDLSLAGRVSYISETGGLRTQKVCFDQPLLRLPNLAIHMNRKVNEEGLKLHKQNELPLMMSEVIREQLDEHYFNQFLEQACELESGRIVSWELTVYDTQQGVFWGDKQQFFADSQLDNLASCHAALQALLSPTSLQSDQTLVCAFFDHEEIGSESRKGADGCFMPDVLHRIASAQNLGSEDFRRVLARSFMISADMAHAYQPNFASAYEPEHKVLVNQGPVIKVNANQRYTSESVSEAQFIHCCEMADSPYQKYSHRTDIPCGSTIGPMTSAKLGIRTVDVGNPMWAMHSIRESAGVKDHQYMIDVLGCFFRSDTNGN